MRRILNLLGVFVISLLMMSSYTLAQNKKSSKGAKDIHKQTTMQNDKGHSNSMAYYKYAEKNIITDKSTDETYKGKFYGQKDMGKSGMSNSKMSTNMKSSHKNMMSSNDKMMEKNKMGKKSKWSSTKSNAKKNWKKKKN